MTKRWLLAGALWILLLGSAGLLQATTILETGSDSHLFQTIAVNFEVTTKQNQNDVLPGHSGYYQPPATEAHNIPSLSVGVDLVSPSSFQFLGFAGPGTLASAMLSLSNVYTPPTWTLTTSGLTGFSPSHLVLGGTGHYIITAGAATLELDAATFVPIDLLHYQPSIDAGVAAAILAGNPVTVSWRQLTFDYSLDITLANHTVPCTPGHPTCYDQTDRWTSAPSGDPGHTSILTAYSGTLTYDYTENPPSSIPEPAAAVLLGAGLLALGALRRFC